MIHYDLQCKNGHVFEAWFRSSSDFDTQAASGIVVCPHCQDTGITRALMAPNVAKKGNAKIEPMPRPSNETAANPPVPQAADQPAPPEIAVRQALRALRQVVEKNFEHVGSRFAEEARKIHYGETDARAIYGDTTPEQAEALADEGIAVSSIPWLRETDS
ncbi:MAG TPA: DUF1178 family protein [Stellaceae bacterium]|jgi:hypothetical protein|nr:DUF1178 family protein [Stellaceae bacterium]